MSADLRGRKKLLADADYDRILAAVQARRRAQGVTLRELAARCHVALFTLGECLYKRNGPGLLVDLAGQFGVLVPPLDDGRCKRGHPYSTTPGGYRACKTCQNARAARRRAVAP